MSLQEEKSTKHDKQKTIWKRRQRLGIGAMLPQAKEYLGSPQARRGKDSSLEAWEVAWDCWYLNFGPTASSDVREEIHFILDHSDLGAFLQRNWCWIWYWMWGTAVTNAWKCGNNFVFEQRVEAGQTWRHLREIT